jgi:hypothetical protein
MISYGRGINKELIHFINDQRYRFFYTETVEAEFKNTECFVEIPKPFTLIQSEISDLKKEKAIELFHGQWTSTFKNKRRNNHAQEQLALYTELSKSQLTKFKDDLLIIMEAGYSQFEQEDLDIQALITDDVKLYTKFFSRPNTREVLEDSINLAGLEHLIEVDLLEEILEDRKKQIPTTT